MEGSQAAWLQCCHLTRADIPCYLGHLIPNYPHVNDSCHFPPPLLRAGSGGVAVFKYFNTLWYRVPFKDFTQSLCVLAFTPPIVYLSYHRGYSSLPNLVPPTFYVWF